MYDPLMHRRQSMRLNKHDYSKAGAYFITICTKNKHPFLGSIESGILKQTPAAVSIQCIWKQIPGQFPFVELGEFIVMPNHIHGIIIIHEHVVGARLIAPLRKPNQIPGGFAGNNNPMFNQNLSRIIRWFKGRCSYEIRKSDSSFEWQRNYYDHIIRDTESFERICKYIRNNPKKYIAYGHY